MFVLFMGKQTIWVTALKNMFFWTIAQIYIQKCIKVFRCVKFDCLFITLSLRTKCKSSPKFSRMLYLSMMMKWFLKEQLPSPITTSLPLERPLSILSSGYANKNKLTRIKILRPQFWGDLSNFSSTTRKSSREMSTLLPENKHLNSLLSSKTS